MKTILNMLSFVVSECGNRPEHSNMFSNGYKILSPSILKFSPYSTIKIDIGLILSCPDHDFIHIVIDDAYNNLLKIENNIIEDSIKTTYTLIIKNMTNNMITLDKDNALCHIYTKDKKFLYATKIEDSKMQFQQYDDIIQNSNIVIIDNITNTTSLIPEVVQEVVPEVVVEEKLPEVVQEVVPEVVVEEVVPKVVAEKIVENIVQEVVNKIVNDTVREKSEETVLHDNVALVKRKYIRKKQTKTSLN